jgi:hypothetical protein
MDGLCWCVAHHLLLFFVAVCGLRLEKKRDFDLPSPSLYRSRINKDQQQNKKVRSSRWRFFNVKIRRYEVRNKKKRCNRGNVMSKVKIQLPCSECTGSVDVI